MGRAYVAEDSAGGWYGDAGGVMQDPEAGRTREQAQEWVIERLNHLLERPAPIYQEYRIWLRMSVRFRNLFKEVRAKLDASLGSGWAGAALLARVLMDLLDAKEPRSDWPEVDLDEEQAGWDYLQYLIGEQYDRESGVSGREHIEQPIIAAVHAIVDMMAAWQVRAETTSRDRGGEALVALMRVAHRQQWSLFAAARHRLDELEVSKQRRADGKPIPAEG